MKKRPSSPDRQQTKRLPLDVLITVDTEIWPEWNARNEKGLGIALEREYFGHTDSGDYGIPFQLKVLDTHQLKAVFFVEALIANVFGIDALKKMIEPIRTADQEIQLHTHAEWADYFREPLIPGQGRRDMGDFTVDEQTRFIEAGLHNMARCGIASIRAFRAGNFGANTDTLKALARCGIAFDSSYNHCFPSYSFPDLPRQDMRTQPWMSEGVCEVPISCYVDAPSHARHVQLCACSWSELHATLEAAWKQGWSALVIVSHSFELMNRARTGPDPIVKRRFEKLCAYLDIHRDRFRTAGFSDLDPQVLSTEVLDSPIISTIPRTLSRFVQQALRRLLWNRRPPSNPGTDNN